MRMMVLAALVPLGLGACTTTAGADTALARLAGQPVQLMFEQLGPPSSSTRAGADTIYAWHSAKTVHGIPLGGTTFGPPAYAGPPVPYTCNIRIVADGAGRIKDWRFDEQTGGCRESARSLTQLAYSDQR